MFIDRKCEIFIKSVLYCSIIFLLFTTICHYSVEFGLNIEIMSLRYKGLLPICILTVLVMLIFRFNVCSVPGMDSVVVCIKKLKLVTRASCQ